VRASQLLDMLRDARELGDVAFESSVLEQLDLDAVYVRQSIEPLFPWRPYPYERDEYDDLEDSETIDAFRARIGEQYRAWQKRDWAAWRSLAPSPLSTLAAIYKAHYSEASIANLAMRQNATYAELAIQRPFIPHRIEASDEDAVECRFGGWSDMLRHKPMVFGTFPMTDATDAEDDE
jgi:hypothetical protein